MNTETVEVVFYKSDLAAIAERISGEAGPEKDYLIAKRCKERAQDMIRKPKLRSLLDVLGDDNGGLVLLFSIAA